MKRFLVCLLALLCLGGVAFADSFTMLSCDMDVRVDQNGAGWFTETLLYDFDESYNGILREIVHDDVLTLSELSLYVDGGTRLTQVETLDGVPYTFTAEQSGDVTSIRAYAPGGKGERNFRIEYRIGGFAQRYRDTARINHLFLESEMRYKNITFRVALPQEDASQILAFAHGAIGPGFLNVQGGQVTLGPAPLSRGDKVEMQILFPASWLPDAVIIEQDMLEEALEIEREIEEYALQEAARKERQARIIVIGTLAALGAYAVASLLVFLSMRGKYGLKHTIAPVTDEGLLRGMTAAEAEALKNGAVSSSGLSATLLELTEQGVLTMYQEEDNTAFTYAQKRGDLAPHQQKLLNWLFEEDETVWVSEFDAGDDEKAAAAFTKGYNEWKAQVMQDVRDRGWVFANGGARGGAVAVVSIAGLVIAGFLFRHGLWPLGIAAILLDIILTVAFSRIRRMTDAGENQVAAIDGFIANYRDKLEKNPASVLGHTPLMMALGYMEPLAEWIDRNPGYTDAYYESMPPYWMYAGWHHSAVHMNQSIREAQSHNVGTQSGGGSGSSGGGFSGGTGGGSHGAW